MGGRRQGEARAMSSRYAHVLVALVVATLALTGCGSMMSVQMMKGVPGDDLGPVRAASTRQQVEARLGAPVKTWITGGGVEYRLYRYDPGVPPDEAAWLLVPIDVLTLGLPTLIDKATASGPAERERRLRNLAVAYDAAGAVIGVFVGVGAFTALL
jgi:hypothetical protein